MEVMKKLDWFILKSYLGPLIMTFFIALFILLMQFVWKYIDDLVGKGLEWYIIVKLMINATVTFIPLALPLAILLSSLMMFGNMGEHYELVAIKSAGISLRRIMMPLILVSMLISGVAFYFSNVVLPYANLKFLSLLYDVRSKKLAFNIKEGVFYNGIEGYVIRVGKKEQDGNTIRDVMVYDHSGRTGNTSLTTAEWGKMELTSDKRFLIFRLFNGTNYEERTDLRHSDVTHPFQRTKFQEQFQMFDLSAFQLTRTDEKLFKNNFEMLNIGQLRHSIDSLKEDCADERGRSYKSFFRTYYPNTKPDSVIYAVPVKTVLKISDTADILSMVSPSERKSILKDARGAAKSAKENIEAINDILTTKNRLISKHLIVMHKKFTFSIACFLLFFIGAPLGAIIRKGGLGLPAVISTVFFILFWILSFIGEKYTVAAVLPAWQGMWIAPTVILPIGIFLTYKATIDATLLDMDSWSRIFIRLFRRKEGVII
jgi:lipopolysaccharide export system permease protein